MSKAFKKKLHQYYRARASQTGGYAVECLIKLRRARSDDRRNYYERIALAWARLAIHYANSVTPEAQS